MFFALMYVFGLMLFSDCKMIDIIKIACKSDAIDLPILQLAIWKWLYHRSYRASTDLDHKLRRAIVYFVTHCGSMFLCIGMGIACSNTRGSRNTTIASCLHRIESIVKMLAKSWHRTSIFLLQYLFYATITRRI